MTHIQAKIIYKAMRYNRGVISSTISNQAQQLLVSNKYAKIYVDDYNESMLKVTKRGLVEASEYFGDLRPLINSFTY